MSEQILKLEGGPKDGHEITQPKGVWCVVFPFVRMNDAGTDNTLGELRYDARSGQYLGERVLTETMNADEIRETVKFLWRDFHSEEPV